MAKSEITKGFIDLDIIDCTDLFGLTAHEKLIMLYCILQGTKNNVGIFKMHRGQLSMWLGIPPEEIHSFFEKRKDLIELDERTHLIWVKNLYSYIDLNLDKPLHKKVQKKVKGVKTKETIEIMDLSALGTKNRFISKVNSVFRQDTSLQIFANAWINHNFVMLNKVNEEVKSIKGNKYSLDKLFQSYQQGVLRI